MSMILPIILYDVNHKELNKQIILDSGPTIYFYSYQNISVRVVENDEDSEFMFYSVKQDGSELKKEKAQSFNNLDNFGYTLYIPENNKKIVVEVTGENYKQRFIFTTKFSNIIDETNEHYLDLLTNKNLPTFEELEKCLPNDSNKVELIKRLLLDFQHIVKHKGTKFSIVKFFEFLGYSDVNLSVLDIYKASDGSLSTSIKDKLTDQKTGNYTVEFDTYTKSGYDDNNLPINIFKVEDLDFLLDSLIYSVELANKYFTIKEQRILFFGFNYNSNVPNEISTTSTFDMIFENNLTYWKFDIHIDIYENLKIEKISNFSNIPLEISKNILVENCLQYNELIERSEIKVIVEDTEVISNSDYLFFVEREIISNEEITEEELSKLYTTFGNVINIDFSCVESLSKIVITDYNNQLIQIEKSFEEFDDVKNILFAIKQKTKIKIEMYFRNNHNGYEEFTYFINVDDNKNRIDIENFNSIKLIDDNEISKISRYLLTQSGLKLKTQKGEYLKTEFTDKISLKELYTKINDITLDIDSPTKVNEKNIDLDYIITDFSLIPEELSEYYKTPISISFQEFLADKYKYKLNLLNKNISVNDLTESIPVELLDNTLELLVFDYNDSDVLELNIYNTNTNQYETLSLDKFSELKTKDKYFDNIFVTVMDIVEYDESIKKYWFITSTTSSVEFTNITYDFRINNLSIYDLPSFKKHLIYFNHDFGLFPIQNQTKYYLSNYDNLNPIIVKSVFQRLTNLNDLDSINLKKGDIIFFRLNDNLIANEKNISWKLYNSFTGELLYETISDSLVYRINESCLYDIEAQFYIEFELFTIKKQSILSSWERNY